MCRCQYPVIIDNSAPTIMSPAVVTIIVNADLPWPAMGDSMFSSHDSGEFWEDTGLTTGI